MNKVLLGTVSYLALAGIAAAADMPVKAYVAAPATSWAGCYIGAHGAVVAHRDSYNGTGNGDAVNQTLTKTVGGGGGQIGCNWQDHNLVYGIEADGTVFSARSSAFGPNDGTDWQTLSQAKWLATFRGRVGITAGTGGNTMIYLTGGLAIGGVKDGVQQLNAVLPAVFVSNTLVGWTAGFGAERMLTRNWTIKAEALYVNLGSNNANIPTSGGGNGPYNIRHNHEFAVGRVGLNYKF